MSLREFVEENKQMRLSWKGGLAIFLGTILIGLLFFHFGKLALARPTIFSVIMIVTAIAMKRELRRRVWFWITITIIMVLHVLLILFVPWTTDWVPAIVMIPFGIADLYAMLAILSGVGKFVERPKTAPLG